MHSITERQKLSTASYHTGQKAVILINWILVNLAMCLGLGTSSSQSGIWFQKRGKNPKKANCNTQVKLLRICLSTYSQEAVHFQWLHMCSLFWLFTKTHLNTLSLEEILFFQTSLSFYTRVHVYVINTVSKSALVSIYWHLKYTANKYSKWKLWVVKKLLQCYFMLPQKRASGSYVFVLHFQNRNIIQLHLGTRTTLSF